MIYSHPLPPLPIVDNALFIDGSTLKTYLTCPRKYEFYSLHKREAGESDALLFGQLIHTCLEHFYKHPESNTNLEVYETLIDTFYSLHPDLGSGSQRTAENAKLIMSSYIEQYGTMEPFDVVQFDSKPLVELPFAEPLGVIRLPDGVALNIIWTGKIDLAGTFGDALDTIDHKTAQQAGDSYWAGFELDQSQQGYCWALQRILKRPIHGFMINGIILTKSGNLTLARNRYPVDQDQLADWQHNTLKIIENLLTQHHDRYLPQHKTSCIQYFKRCDYHSVCRCAPNERDSVLYSNNFRDVTWSPLNND